MTHPLPWIYQSFWRRGSPGPCPSPFQTSCVIFKGVDISGRKYKLVLASFFSYGELKARHALGLILFQTFFPFLIFFFRFQSPCHNMRPSCYTFLFYRLKSSLVDTFFRLKKVLWKVGKIGFQTPSLAFFYTGVASCFVCL